MASSAPSFSPFSFSHAPSSPSNHTFSSSSSPTSRLKILGGSLRNVFKGEIYVQERPYKIMIMGRHCVGKTVVFRQLLNMYDTRSAREVDFERRVASEILSKTIISQLKILLTPHPNLPEMAPELQEYVTHINGMTLPQFFSLTNFPKMVEVVQALWADASMPDRVEFYELPNAHFLIPRVKDFTDFQFPLTHADMLHVVWNNTWSKHLSFEDELLGKFEVHEGDPPWDNKDETIAANSSVACAIFVVDVGSYHAKGTGYGEGRNALTFTLTQFEKWLSCYPDSKICVFFNQIDKFRSSIEGDMLTKPHSHRELKFFLPSPLADIVCEFLAKKCFPLESVFSEYAGGPNYENAISFIHTLFQNTDKRAKGSPPMSFFDICALDTVQMQKVLNEVLEQASAFGRKKEAQTRTSTRN